ncbi:hypothetical protein CPB84DRAFT_1842482 [Gymnopilus junonius]|uniref:Uncharacterized protein n=1 Tax=Gymnopilus junonius TaxID=109634 RepID=A0A9P5NVA7_GYMJU|nr:hypothetical protein CPB84DRAFT_1842482 [Gymnopilus junonius]
MGRHQQTRPPAPPQAKTAAISQARQAASRAYHAHNAFSSLNSRQANAANHHVVVEDDGLTSYDEADGDDVVIVTTGASASAEGGGGGGGGGGGSLFTPENSPPPPPPQPTFPGPAPATHSNYKVIGEVHQEYDPANPHFDMPAQANFHAFGGQSVVHPPQVQNTLMFPPPSVPHHAHPQVPQSLFPHPPIVGPVQSAFPPLSGHPPSDFPQPPINVPPQSAFSLPHVNAAPQSAFPLAPIHVHPQSAFPPPAICGPAQSAFPPLPTNDSPQSALNNLNSNNDSNGNSRNWRKTRWDVGPEQVLGMNSKKQSEPRLPWREQQEQQPQQPRRSWSDDGGWLNHHDPRKALNKGGWGQSHPASNAHQHQNQWGPRHGNVQHGHEHNQAPVQVQDPHRGPPQPLYQQRQQHQPHHGNVPVQMDVAVSQDTATAFLNNVLTDIQATGVVGCPTAPAPAAVPNAIVDVDMGPPPALGHPIHRPLQSDHSIESVPMDTSACFNGPTVIVAVDNVNYQQQQHEQQQQYYQQQYQQQQYEQQQYQQHQYQQQHEQQQYQQQQQQYVQQQYQQQQQYEQQQYQRQQYRQQQQLQHHQQQQQDVNMDIDVVSQPMSIHSYTLVHAGSASSHPWSGSQAGYGAVQPGAVVPYSGPTAAAASLKPLPSDDVDMRLVIHDKRNRQHQQDRPMSGAMDVDSPKPSNACVLASTFGSSQPVNNLAVVSFKAQQKQVSTAAFAPNGSIAEAERAAAKAKAQAKALLAPEGVQRPPLASKTKPQPVVEGSKSKGDAGADKTHAVKDKGKGSKGKEKVPEGVSGGSKTNPNSTTAKVKPKIISKNPTSASAGQSSLACDENDSLSSQTESDVEEKACVVSDRKGKGKEKAQLIRSSSSGEFEAHDNRMTSQPTKDKGQCELPLGTDQAQSERIKFAVDINPVSGVNFDSLNDALSLIKSQLANAENAFVELRSRYAYTPESTPLRPEQAQQSKLVGKVENAVDAPQPPANHTPDSTPPQKDTQVVGPSSEVTQGAAIGSQPSLYTPKDNTPHRLVQAYEPDLLQHEGALPAIAQSAHTLTSHSMHVGSSKFETQHESYATGVHEVATPVYALPQFPPMTATRTREIVDPFKNVKVSRLAAPRTPQTPSPLPPSPSSHTTCSGDNHCTVDLIDFDDEIFGNFSLIELSSPKTNIPLSFNTAQHSTPSDSGAWMASSVWDDLASLEQSFVSSNASSVIHSAVSPEELTIDDFLSEKFAKCFSLSDEPLIDSTVSDEIVQKSEAMLFESVEPATEVDFGLRSPEQVEQHITAAQDYMQAAAQEIQDINHRLSLNIESARPMRVYVKIDKRKVGNNIRPRNHTRKPRYLEPPIDERAKRIRVSCDGIVAVQETARPSSAPLTSSKRDERWRVKPPSPSAKQSDKPKSVHKTTTNSAPVAEKVMPGAFPLGESEIQYGPGLSALLRKLVYLCFGW